jgi:hypothetical protein
MQPIVFPTLKNSEFQKLVLRSPSEGFEPHPLKPETTLLMGAKWDVCMSPMPGQSTDGAEGVRDDIRQRVDDIYRAVESRVSAIVKIFEDRRYTNEGARERAAAEVKRLFTDGEYLAGRGWVGSTRKARDLVELRAKLIVDAIAELPIPKVDKTIAAEWRAVVRAQMQGAGVEILKLKALASENGVEILGAVLAGGPALSGLSGGLHRSLLLHTRAMGNLEAFTALRIEAECLDSLRLAALRAATEAVKAARIEPIAARELLMPYNDTPQFARVIEAYNEFDAAFSTFAGTVGVLADPQPTPAGTDAPAE